ncbi:unnamed protein product, partial [Pylaiella littoralis]
MGRGGGRDGGWRAGLGGGRFRSPRHFVRAKSAQVNGGRGYGELDGSRDTTNTINNDNNNNSSSSSSSSSSNNNNRKTNNTAAKVDGGSGGRQSEGADVEEPRPSAPGGSDAAKRVAVATARMEEELEKKLAGITHPLDIVYAMMPHIQDSLKEKT